MLMFGAAVLKCHRLHVIMLRSSKKLRVVHMPNSLLFRYLSLMTVCLCAYFAAWSALAPVQPKLVELQQVQFYWCANSGSPLWTIIVIAWDAILLLYGVYLCVATRNFHAMFNESKQLGVVLYNSTLIGGVALVGAYVFVEDDNAFHLLLSLACLLLCSMLLGVLIAYKLYLCTQTMETISISEKNSTTASSPHGTLGIDATKAATIVALPATGGRVRPGAAYEMRAQPSPGQRSLTIAGAGVPTDSNLSHVSGAATASREAAIAAPVGVQYARSWMENAASAGNVNGEATTPTTGLNPTRPAWSSVADGAGHKRSPSQCSPSLKPRGHSPSPKHSPTNAAHPRHSFTFSSRVDPAASVSAGQGLPHKTSSLRVHLPLASGAIALSSSVVTAGATGTHESPSLTAGGSLSPRHRPSLVHMVISTPVRRNEAAMDAPQTAAEAGLTPAAAVLPLMVLPESSFVRFDPIPLGSADSNGAEAAWPPGDPSPLPSPSPSGASESPSAAPLQLPSPSGTNAVPRPPTTPLAAASGD
jgi:hypothetical protein